MGKPTIGIRLHGELGPEDVIVNGPELARFALEMGREIDRLQNYAAVLIDVLNKHVRLPEKGADPRPVNAGVPADEVVPANAGSSTQYTPSHANVCPDCHQPYFTIPRMGIAHACSAQRRGCEP